ncbi:hypothetical protein D9613_012933 [Agrocybe pediades]|uniref:DUF6699 domain-containing protein n=1 Tax=Agrocybe pediades TaxID=84607 RepID=A0A8H4QEJ7_9AGAR|nr:hypothetical protein D9613_012933 [Agrocybe pediades]
MPGRIRHFDDEPKNIKVKNDSLYRGTYGMPEHTTPRVAGGEPYTVPYPFRTVTTGYGLCEPQWSEGPPPIIHHLSPYAPVPLPPLYPINILLAAHSNTLRWNIHERPETAVAAPVYSPGWQAMPATEPASAGPVTIRLEPLKALIVVHASASGFVTVADVLYAVYNAIQQHFAQSPRVQGRPSRGPMGLNTTPLLDSRAQWVGLAPSRIEQDVWVLHTTSAVS